MAGGINAADLRKVSKLERMFMLRWEGQPGVIEHRFHADRKWRFDFAWPNSMAAVECEGGVYTGGRHTRGKGYEDDCIKYAEATLLGWTVFRLTERMIKDRDLLRRIRDYVNATNEP